jgi:hypothetical protein
LDIGIKEYNIQTTYILCMTRKRYGLRKDVRRLNSNFSLILHSGGRSKQKPQQQN